MAAWMQNDLETTGCSNQDQLPFRAYANWDTDIETDDAIETLLYMERETQSSPVDFSNKSIGQRSFRPYYSEPAGVYPSISLNVNEHLSPCFYRQRAPKPMKTPHNRDWLMEKHRRNERLRHQSLNRTINDICGNIPSYRGDTRETKVDMMRRIIKYIVYLEYSIVELCDTIGCSLNDTQKFLTTKLIRKIDCKCGPVKDRLLSQISTKDYDFLVHTVISKCNATPDKRSTEEIYQRPTIKTSPFSNITYRVPSHSCLYEVPHSHTLSHIDRKVGKESSGDIAGDDGPRLTQDSGIMDTFGDASQDLYEETVITEPTVVIGDLARRLDCHVTNAVCTPGVAIIDSHVSSAEASDVNEVTKTIHPKETIHGYECFRNGNENRELSNLINRVSKRGRKRGHNSLDYSKRIYSHAYTKDDDMLYTPTLWNFNHEPITKRQKVRAAKLKSDKLAADVDQNAQNLTRNKPGHRTDQRRISWMNGFMMYSQLNRTQFIQCNPGVHISHISKMMGHCWRMMTHDDQQPYRDKALQYGECLVSMEAANQLVQDCHVEIISTNGIADKSN